MTNVLADLTLKIFFSHDPDTLRRLNAIPMMYVPQPKEGPVTAFEVGYLTFQTEEETKKEYDAVLNIIITYQDRFAF